MTDEYIRKRDAITAACKGFCHPGVRCPETPCREQTKYLRELPSSADVVQVVRCVDCRRCSYDPLFNYFWCNLTLGTKRVKPDDFCSYGEKRGEE